MHKPFLINGFSKSTIKLHNKNLIISGEKYCHIEIKRVLNEIRSSNSTLVFDGKLRDMLKDRGVLSSGLINIAHCVMGPHFEKFVKELESAEII